MIRQIDTQQRDCDGLYLCLHKLIVRPYRNVVVDLLLLVVRS